MISEEDKVIEGLTTAIELLAPILHPVSYCPICGAVIDDGYGYDCGCFGDLHYGKD